MGDSIREGLEGLSKIDSFADHLYIAIYWVGVIFVILFVAYLFAALNCSKEFCRTCTGADKRILGRSS